MTASAPDHGGLWRGHRDRRAIGANKKSGRGSQHAGEAGKSDNVGLRRGSCKSTIDVTDLIWKRKKSEHEELLAVRTNRGRMERRMERHYSIASIRRGQAHRGEDVPAD